jgi:hypothetical protein
VRFSLRREKESGKDVVAFLSFLHLQPEDPETLAVEVARVALPGGLARALVDAMCKTLDYYPTKPDEGAT